MQHKCCIVESNWHAQPFSYTMFHSEKVHVLVSCGLKHVSMLLCVGIGDPYTLRSGQSEHYAIYHDLSFATS